MCNIDVKKVKFSQNNTEYNLLYGGSIMEIILLIGNGFDICIANKFNIENTSYKKIYEWNQKYGFKAIEQKQNDLVNSIYSKENYNLWSDFEDGLIEYFKTIDKDENKIINFLANKYQFCGYI